MATGNTLPQMLACPIASEASQSDINQIPVEPTPLSALASQKQGFPHLTMLPLKEGGESPYGEDFNGLFNLVSSHTFYLQNGGTYTFNPALSSVIGGYAKNQILWYFPTDGLPVPVISMMDNNTFNFVDNPTLIDGVKWAYFLSAKDVPVVTIPATSGTIALEDNTIYAGEITEAVTFSLPAVTDATIYHQIKLMLTLPVVTINWGTTNYIGGDAPDVSEAGQYMIYFDFVPNLNAWAVGTMIVKSAGESGDVDTQ